MRPEQAVQAGPATAIPQDATFVNFLCYAVDPLFRRLPAAERQKGTREFLNELARSRQGVDVRS